MASALPAGKMPALHLIHYAFAGTISGWWVWLSYHFAFAGTVSGCWVSLSNLKMGVS
jgi:hypothetical protein